MVLHGNHHLGKDDQRLGRDRTLPPIDSVAKSPVLKVLPDNSIYPMRYMVIAEKQLLQDHSLSHRIKHYSCDISIHKQASIIILTQDASLQTRTPAIPFIPNLTEFPGSEYGSSFGKINVDAWESGPVTVTMLQP